MISKPEYSQAVLNNPAFPTPTFLADVLGTYAISSGVVGFPFSLDGSGSADANGDLLTYRWSMVTWATGSEAALINPNSVAPSFVPDIAGTYVVSLVVNDGLLDSDSSHANVVGK